jgi:hypothetical protein
MATEPLIETGPLGDKRTEDGLRKKASARANRLKEALRWLLGDPRGRLYLGMLVRESHALTPEVGRSSDTVLFREGMRTMGLKVLSDVRALDNTALFLALIQDVIGKPTGDNDGGRREPNLSESESKSKSDSGSDTDA